MFEPSFKFILDKDSFNQGTAVCLGSQMIKIINSLEGMLEPHVWYGADIDGFGKGIKKFNLRSQEVKKIGTDDSLISICNEVDQLLSGVFLAIQENSFMRNSIKLNISTEDEPFRQLKIEGVLLEIRAFDTSFFEFFSENQTLINKLSAKFNSNYTSKIDEKK